jgi:hypothetical protein
MARLGIEPQPDQPTLTPLKGEEERSPAYLAFAADGVGEGDALRAAQS